MATTASGTEFSGDVPAALQAEGEKLPPGLGPWTLAWRRLRRNHVALFFGGLFILIVVLCLLAPVYAKHVAHQGPSFENITGTVKVHGKNVDIVSPTGIPVGPTWHSKYFLGSDANGRDVAVRLLYGGRNSLEIGFVATLITMVLALILGIISGFFRGITDGFISRLLDVIWAFPAILLGVTLGTALAVGGLGPLKSNTLLLPAIVVGIVYIPYVAKPVRGQVLSTIVVFVPLILANAILLEAALSYLGAGVQPPNPSWGTMIADGIMTIPAAFHDVLVPGIMLVLTVLSINVFGDGLRDALDPRAKVRIAH